MDVEGALDGWPIFHVVPVTLAGREKKKEKKRGRDNNTVPRGFFHVAVVSVCDVKERDAEHCGYALNIN